MTTDDRRLGMLEVRVEEQAASIQYLREARRSPC